MDYDFFENIDFTKNETLIPGKEATATFDLAKEVDEHASYDDWESESQKYDESKVLAKKVLDAKINYEENLLKDASRRFELGEGEIYNRKIVEITNELMDDKKALGVANDLIDLSAQIAEANGELTEGSAFYKQLIGYQQSKELKSIEKDVKESERLRNERIIAEENIDKKTPADRLPAYIQDKINMDEYREQQAEKGIEPQY